MKIRALPAALGLCGFFPPLLTRLLMTAVFVAPALWAHVESAAIPVADSASGSQEETSEVSVVHVAIGGALPNRLDNRSWFSSDMKAFQLSPLDRRFRRLLAEHASGSGGGASLLSAFHECFMGFSPSEDASDGFDGIGAVLAGTFRASGMSLWAETEETTSDQPSSANWAPVLVPIFQSNAGMTAEPGATAGLVAGASISSSDRFSASMPVSANFQNWNSGPAANSASWEANATNGALFSTAPIASASPLPPDYAIHAPPTAGASSIASFASPVSASRRGPAPAFVAAAPSSHTIVLASISSPTPNLLMSNSSSGGVTASSSGGSATPLATPSGPANIGYQFVTVGNPNNSPDSNNGFGAVGYVYQIGQKDVTLNQYVTFLNAVASSDPNGLFNPSMTTDLNSAGIKQNGSSGSFTYSVIGDGLRPVTYVSWFDAARLANWMQNGQPTGLGEVAGSTEQGAYTLNNATSGIITVNPGALYWIPTENEWYKAAYYNPSTGAYSRYATQSNSFPGNTVGSAPNQINYDSGLYSVTQNATYSTAQNYLTEVGAFSGSASAYGTYDQNGDVYQWTDAVVNNGNNRGNVGGSWNSPAVAFNSFFFADNGQLPTEQNSTIGIRLGAALGVPEPTTLVSVLLGGGLLFARRKRHSTS